MKVESGTDAHTDTKEREELTILAQAQLPTRYGIFRAVAFTRGSRRIDDIALVRGDLRGAVDVPTRVHSECVTGDVFHSMRCDCRDQLEMAQKHFATCPKAVLLYMRQEGRGIGLANKIAAYALQEQGFDTVDANIHLGFDDDLRSYDIAAEMLRVLGVVSIVLYTNNPRKIDGLRRCGITISRREPITTAINIYNDHYLHTKQEKSGHLLNLRED